MNISPECPNSGQVKNDCIELAVILENYQEIYDAGRIITGLTFEDAEAFYRLGLIPSPEELPERRKFIAEELNVYDLVISNISSRQPEMAEKCQAQAGCPFRIAKNPGEYIENY